jgi:transposase
VGPIVALSFVTAIDDPMRFSNSEDLGAYFGLTPRQYQSGETDISGGVSRRGDLMTRTPLVQAATVLLARSEKWCCVKAQPRRLAQNIHIHRQFASLALEPNPDSKIRNLSLTLCRFAVWSRA